MMMIVLVLFGKNTLDLASVFNQQQRSPLESKVPGFFMRSLSALIAALLSPDAPSTSPNLRRMVI